MLKQGIPEMLAQMLSDDDTEKWQHASNLLRSLAEYCELIIL